MIKKRTLAPGIVIYSDVIQGYETLIDQIENGAKQSNTDWMQSTAIKNGVLEVNKEIRDTDAIYINYQDYVTTSFINEQHEFSSKIASIFFEAFSPLEVDYKQEHGLDTSWHDSYGILRYSEGQKVVNHVDDNKMFLRRMSIVYYLNDNYEGGEVIFPRFDVNYKPVANELLLFPSNYMYNHSVLPVTDGTRYSVVSWLR